jgi:hypothetical protein
LDVRNNVEHSSPKLNELLLKFASLGDNCEFGLVQRSAEAEPLDLLRFAGFHIPVEHLIAALAARFEGLGEPEAIKPYLDGADGRREWLVKESAYDLMYHTFPNGGLDRCCCAQPERSQAAEVLAGEDAADLACGEKIWVWRSGLISDPAQVYPLHHQLRRFGPNRLLWVVEANAEHPAKGCVERFAPYIAATEICKESWYLLCRNACDCFPCHSRALTNLSHGFRG